MSNNSMKRNSNPPTRTHKGQRGQVLGHIREQAARGAALGRALDLIPVAAYRGGPVDGHVAEHMGVAADQLLRAVL